MFRSVVSRSRVAQLTGMPLVAQRSFGIRSKPMNSISAMSVNSSTFGKQFNAPQCRFYAEPVTSDTVLADNGGSSLRPLVSPKWLKDNMANVKIIDASWRLNGGNACHQEFDKVHIPGALYFDVDEVADKTKSKPHALPAPEVFAAALGKMGITELDNIVVYDSSGLLGAAR